MREATASRAQETTGPSRGRRPTALLAAAALIALAGCGGGGDSQPTPLVDYLPRQSGSVVLVDFDGVKQQLDLSASDELPSYDDLTKDISVQKDVAAQAELYDAAALTVAPLYDPATSEAAAFDFEPKRDPLSRALDTGAIEEAASNELGQDAPVVVIRTLQPFEQLASRLEDAGFQRDGETLTSPDTGGSQLTSAGDGVLVFSGGSDVSASELVASPPGGPAAPVAIIKAAKDVVAVASNARGGGCVAAIGGWHDAEGGQGVVQLTIDQPAEPDRFDGDAVDLSGGLMLGQPSADGEQLNVPFTLGDPANAVSPVDDLIKSGAVGTAYDCG